MQARYSLVAHAQKLNANGDEVDDFKLVLKPRDPIPPCLLTFLLILR